MANSIAFVDTRVPNYLELARAFDASVEIVFLAANEDGVQQIADWLEGRSGVEAVHIISHGAPASIQLGTSELSSYTLPAYEQLLSRIGSALSNDADILLYGCDVASGPEGQAFVEQLATFTGADVAASNDATGATLQGGDARLEINVGDVSTQALVTQVAFDEMGALLATYSSAYHATSRGHSITLVDGSHTFEVTGLPFGYSGWFYYSLISSSALVLYDKDNITLPFETAADFTIDTTGKDLVQFDIYSSSTGGYVETHYWNISRDTTAPSSPGTPDLVASSDTGVSSTDNITNNTTPTFSWTAATDSQSGIAGYRWSIDSGGWSDIGNNTSVSTGPISGQGVHTFYAQARDAAGNLGLTSQLTFTLDTIAPGTPSGLSPTGQTSNATPTFTWSGADTGGSGIWKYEIDVDRLFNVFGNDNFTQQTTAASWVGNAVHGAFTPDSYEWQVRAYDIAGNVSNWTADQSLQILQPRITAIRWENAAGDQITDGAKLSVGDTVYVEIDTQGMRGTDAIVYLYEDDAGVTPSEFINSFNIHVSDSSDTARIPWTIPWNIDTDGIDSFPEYRLWRSTDVFETVSSPVLKPVMHTRSVESDQIIGELTLSNVSHHLPQIDVRLERLNGDPLEAGRTTWVLIHGRSDGPQSWEGAGFGGFQTAQLLDHLYPNDQVLLLDWSAGAADNHVDYLGLDGAEWIPLVGAWAARALASIGITGSNLNLVGHSWGSYVAYEISTYNSSVNSIVALDPAQDGVGYDESSINFASRSNIAWAFYGLGEFGSIPLSATADEAFTVNYASEDGTYGPFDAHRAPRLIFYDIVKANDDARTPSAATPLAGLFSLDHLLAQPRVLGPWLQDQ